MENKMIQIQGDRTVVYNGLSIECEAKIFSYIELVDVIIVQLLFKSEMYEESNYGFQNIFCYNKHDGSLKWQVESKEESPYVDIYLKMSRKVDCDIHYKDDDKDDDWGITLKEKFIKGQDRIEARTFSCNGYEIDIETGKVKFLYQGK